MNTKSSLRALLLGLALAASTTHAQDATRWSLDAVLDTRSATATGLPVLAVTPGGAAERMGLVAGDRIVSINGHALTSVESPARVLEEALQAGGERAEVVVLRDGRRVTLQGSLAGTPVSTDRGCGYVSDTDPTPRASEGIYPAEVTQVDGRSTPLQRSPRLRMGSGPRVLVVSESIPNRWFTGAQDRARLRMQRQMQAGAYKAIVVDVAPDTRYSVGARLLRDRLDLDSIRDNAYWEPVVYATRAETCR